jgi:SAM-dependent methyltransferase
LADHDATAAPPPARPIWDGVWLGHRYRERPLRLARAARRLRLLSVLQDLQFDSHLLDVGCGGGENLLLISDRAPVGVNFTGVDLSPVAVKRSAELLKGRATLAVGSACTLPFPNESFTHITMFGVMEHIPDVDVVLSELIRVLRSSGMLYITTSNRHSLVAATSKFRAALGLYPFGYQKMWSAAEVESWLESAFELSAIGIAGAGWDMPLAKIVDVCLSFLGLQTGRYVFAAAKKL